MTHGNDPTVHFIENGRFVCKAEPTAPCRNYPDCACETWDMAMHFGHGRDSTPAPGHEPVPQNECWMDAWINGPGLEDSHCDADGLFSEPEDGWPDGAIDATWEGDYLIWEYVTAEAEVPA